MDLGLHGKVVLVTGGSKGIGLACARAFAAEGATVAIASRGADHLAAAAAALRDDGIDALTVVADLGDASQAKAMVARVEADAGGLDVLVNSAGAAERTPPAELTAAHWHRAMDAKYYTYIHAIDAALPGMLARGAGVIVNIAGMGGKVASPTHLPGGAANAALMLAGTGLANAFAGRGIRVCTVNPGLTMTGRMQQGLEADAQLAGTTPAEVLAQRTRAMPLGRIARPEDIADAVVFLASARAAFLTGAVLSMDGAATPTVV